jgi:hypothetical protein
MKISKYLSKGIGNYCRIEAIMEKVVPSTTFDRLLGTLSKLLDVATPFQVKTAFL